MNTVQLLRNLADHLHLYGGKQEVVVRLRTRDGKDRVVSAVEYAVSDCQVADENLKICVEVQDAASKYAAADR